MKKSNLVLLTAFIAASALLSAPLTAQASAGPYSVAVEAAGKAWLFTLGPAGGSTAGASAVAEVGPIPRIDAAKCIQCNLCYVACNDTAHQCIDMIAGADSTRRETLP